VWQATAQQVMAGVISYVLESPFYKDRRNLGEVNSFFNSGVDLQALMKFIKEKEPYLSKFTMESFNAYLSLSERAAASALLDIQKAMRPFKGAVDLQYRTEGLVCTMDIPAPAPRNG
jgi:type IV secretion system protein VirD4